MPNMLQKLFKKNSTERVHSSNPFVHMQAAEANQDAPTAGSWKYPYQLEVGTGQSVGVQRDHNEDTLFTFTSLIADGQGQQLFGLFIVADGMGGHLNGEVASSVGVRAVAQYLLEQVYVNLLVKRDVTLDQAVQESIRTSINAAQNAVLKNAPGGGTTMTIAMLLGNQLTLAHVGDSRAYFILPDGNAQRLTKDHSFVQHLVDLKEISEQEAAVHPQKNIILKAVGQSEAYSPDIQTIVVPDHAALLMCSDGLWGVVDEEELISSVLNINNPIEACKALVDLANMAGGPDNISVIIVKTPA